MKPTTLRFGSAGIPLCTKPRDTHNGLATVRKLGLEGMELEFVRSIFVTKEKAPLVKKSAEAHDVSLTCHAPYFINLNSDDKKKLRASKDRILNSARMSALCGAWSCCFHPGFYQKQDPKKVYKTITAEVRDIAKTLKKEGVNIWIRPETTGKGSQFGELNELINMSAEIEGVLPCIDFAHLHARSNGKFNTKQEVLDVLSLVEKRLGKEALANMHIHYNGIRYSEKGELNHLNLKESDARWKEVLEAWHEFKLKGQVTCESPNIEQDAMLMQKHWKTF
ncbi:hypothetical protein CMO91_00030 [Candidatus Woesearchaeota archaeon]|nr:hypothetical protein [Candidatus Woesearchaeota archaeon]|tara:strand:+ start:409 stop:1245 length:837 start_codon:yes stop_codon:yes gene_type:complete